jgi:biopolymer transport protein ExbD
MASRKSAKDRDVEPDVTSFSDLAFLLIIFFILTTAFTQIAGVKADIPSGRKSEQKSEKTTTVSLTGKKILLDDKEMDMADLRKKLANMELDKKKQPEERIILLEATDDVEYQRYFEVLTAIGAAGGVVAIVEEEGGGRSGGGS